MRERSSNLVEWVQGEGVEVHFGTRTVTRIQGRRRDSGKILLFGYWVVEIIRGVLEVSCLSAEDIRDTIRDPNGRMS